MFNSGILDVAIGIVFIYLLVSLIVSAVNELCAALLKMRSLVVSPGAIAPPTFRRALSRSLSSTW